MDVQGETPLSWAALEGHRDEAAGGVGQRWANTIVIGGRRGSGGAIRTSLM